ncbi:MAG: septal ring lytic transglycosylase RlpA family protein [Bacteroidota bacterium]|nr:septal ring lytic transglycosylase RlpA family protein [Bacteroidota bacterium]
MKKLLIITALLFLSVPALLVYGFAYSRTDTVPAADSTINQTGIPGFIAYHDSLMTFSEYGVASWYGQNWNGRLTSSGQLFCPDSLTAAHKRLPFGTVVKVTNASNDSVVYVKITDRLPKSSKRSIDLTPYVAKKLNFYSKGLTKVKIEVVGYAPIYKRKKAPVKKAPIKKAPVATAK